MKKIVALVLCLLMVVSLLACSAQPATDESNADSKQTEAGESTVKDIAESKNPQETAETTQQPTELEKLIIDESVKPENYTLSDSGEDYESYTLENITYRDVMNYEEALLKQGFYIQRSVFGRETEADTLQYEIKYLFQYAGTAYITSYTQFEERVAQGLEDFGNLTVTVRARDLRQYNLPALPQGDWRIDDNTNDVRGGWIIHKLNTYTNCSRELRVSLAKDYVEDLKENGYTLNAEEYPEGKEGKYVVGYIPLYYYYAEDALGNSVEVAVSSDETIPTSLVGVTAEEWAEITITFNLAKQD